ncbi:hypothetical protein CBM2592_A10145 [Cupriavidus taiwanensis]|nr:hypothetical protein CBM2588_A10143 [Cupriavidus taiwanensis]SOY42429.1 hypothetical protein CBM2592_A10145 [Cupriavidus taiwanensis]SOY79024.1 hypothetical protein CBM2591_A10144 [Cupriavidus taiwanensis]SOZ50349.1 hypothetical protein CBM2617_A10094 [Cupriavidus taiwanensis]SOZ75693.1 hypothetical protein CBM2622_A10095 [Cupriavidus taiwanensis]
MQIPAHAPNDSLRRIGIPPGYGPTGRPWYQQAAAAGKPVVTPPYVDAGTGKLVVAFAAPVVRDGAVQAVVSGDVAMDTVIANVKAIHPSPASFGMLVARNGDIVAHTDDKLTLKPVTELVPALSADQLAALAGAKTPLEVDVHGSPKLLGARAIAGTDWLVIVALDKAGASAGMRSGRAGGAVDRGGSGAAGAGRQPCEGGGAVQAGLNRLAVIAIWPAARAGARAGRRSPRWPPPARYAGRSGTPCGWAPGTPPRAATRRASPSACGWCGPAHPPWRPASAGRCAAGPAARTSAQCRPARSRPRAPARSAPAAPARPHRRCAASRAGQSTRSGPFPRSSAASRPARRPAGPLPQYPGFSPLDLKST